MEMIKESILVTSEVQKKSLIYKKCTSQRKRLVDLTMNKSSYNYDKRYNILRVYTTHILLHRGLEKSFLRR